MNKIIPAANTKVAVMKFYFIFISFIITFIGEMSI